MNPASIVLAIAIAVLQVSSTAAFVPDPRLPQAAMSCRKGCCTSLRAGEGGEDAAPGAAREVGDEYSLQTWNPLRLLVTKLGFTELRYTSPLNYEKREGVYNCAQCGLDLFDSKGKYDSGSGWPSFWRSTRDGNVEYKREWDGRLECLCAHPKCNAHLGHVFLDGPRPSAMFSEELELVASAPSTDPRGKNPEGPLPRFCVNGAALSFEPLDRGDGSDASSPFGK